MARRGAVLVLACVIALLADATARAGELACTGSPDRVQRLDVSVGGEPAYGSFATPATAPKVLAMYGHGFSFNVDGQRPHLLRTARTLGALTVAMNYRGLQDLPPGPGYPYERSRGWPVRAGAEDLVAAAQLAVARCPSIRHVILLGISMGGNASGIATSLAARRPDGSPLFDYWIGVEGVYNLTELYQGARAVAPANEFAANAKADIEAETGGTPETAPQAYLDRTVVALAPAIARSGLKGVVLVHGREDGLAPFNQAQELLQRLRADGLPTDLYSVGARRPGDDPDTTIGGYAGVSTGGAGHGPEVSENHIVIDTGFDRVAALIARGEPAPCNRDFDVDGLRTPTTTPDPATPTPGCPRIAPLGSGSSSGQAGAGGQAQREEAGCVSRRRFRVTVRGVRRDQLRSLTVFVDGTRKASRRGRRAQAPVDLRGLPRGTVRVRVVARTRSGRRIVDERRYRTCVPRRA